MEELLQVKDVSFGYGENILFENLSFNVSKNCITSFITPNNCGKTTLIKILSGALQTKSTISVDNLLLTKKKYASYIQKIGVVFEDYEEQFFCKTIYEELAFPLENLNCTKRQIENRINELLELFEFFDKTKAISDLSHYEKAKLLLAVAMVHKPKLLLLDNIFHSFSDEERKSIFSLLRKLMEKEEVTIFLTTNSLLDVFLSDYGIVFYNKKIVYSDAPEKIFENENELAKMGLFLPTMIDLSLKLRFYGLMDTILLDAESVVNTLWP